MFSPGEDRELATKLGEVLRDPARRERLAKAALITAKRFEWPRVALKYEAAFASLVANIKGTR
jgi:glycosyltransferase involved in cell wall biosynthesis